MRLRDKVGIVTASTRGIGLAIVRAFAKEGAMVYMAARNEEAAKARAKELQTEGYKAKWVYCDAKEPTSFADMVTQVAQAEGRLDVLVNNFGTSDPKEDKDLAGTKADVFINTVTMNLQSVFIASQAAVAHMKQCGGSIINISSVGGIVPDITQIGYGTSKAAINHITKQIAVQEARHYIRCNAILPGMTATDAVKDRLSEEFKQAFLRHIPLSRMAVPEEIAALAVYLASDESAYTTGQIIAISGGFGLGTPLYGDIMNNTR